MEKQNTKHRENTKRKKKRKRSELKKKRTGADLDKWCEG
jgi:hypothetical protein